jgi:methylmalonyl-CoA mutase
VDPWGGSYYVEHLTAQLCEKAWELIAEVESHGGMTRAIEAGIPKLRIEEAAARKQARIDSSRDVIVGLNRFQSPEEDHLQILEVDNTKVRLQQVERLEKIRAHRDAKAVEQALKALEKAALKKKDSDTTRPEENLLALAVIAARQRASLGEISDAMEKAFGRHRAQVQSISGVYSNEIQNDPSFENARERSDRFADSEGRRPRIMIAKMGQDGHDRGAKVVATAYADLGFDVDIGPLFQTPEEAAKQAVENDVHILGVSSLAAGHKTLVPEVIRALKEHGREDIMVIVGGVIPKQDYDFLLQAGVAGIYGPGTRISDAAIDILQKLGAD